MAKKPDEIERDLELRRQKLHAQVEHFRRRVRDDRKSVTSLPKRVIGGGSNGNGARVGMPFGIADQVSEHPLTSVATGFGLGVVLGVITDSGGNHYRSR